MFTAHSIPAAMADACDYELQLREVARLVVAGLPGRSGSGAEALGAGVAEPLRAAPACPGWSPTSATTSVNCPRQGVGAALLVPIGFVSDHMEVVYDLDTVALTEARELGLLARRAPTVGTHPRFVAGLVELVGERLRRCGTGGRRPPAAPTPPLPERLLPAALAAGPTAR